MNRMSKLAISLIIVPTIVRAKACDIEKNRILFRRNKTPAILTICSTIFAIAVGVTFDVP